VVAGQLVEQPCRVAGGVLESVDGEVGEQFDRDAGWGDLGVVVGEDGQVARRGGDRLVVAGQVA